MSMGTAALKIYIAGPYSASTEEDRRANVSAAIAAALEVFRKGHFPYIPHLTHFVDEYAVRSGITLSWNDYIRWDMPWLRACDALLYLRSSPGADLELDTARSLKKQIFFSVDEVLAVDQSAVQR